MLKTIKISSLCVGFFCLLLAAAWADDRPMPKLIHVTGDAEVSVAPNRAIIRLGVQTWDKDLEKACSENNERVQNTVKRLKQFGISADDIQTGYFNLEPTYQNRNDKHDNIIGKDLVGFQVSKNLTITLKDLERLEEVFSTVKNDGANQVGGIEFKNTELRKYRDQARAMAIRAAKEKAEALAKEIGQSIGKAGAITEDFISPWSSQSQMQNAVQNIAGSGEGENGDTGSISPGKISISARVSVSFELL